MFVQVFLFFYFEEALGFFLSLDVGLDDVLCGLLLVHLPHCDTGDLGDSDEGEEEVDGGEP